MTKKEITEKLQEIFRDIFDDESIVLFDDMTSDDVEDWDSLSHINLINDIEAQFGITFTTDEIVGTKNVGEFIQVIESKL
jgi:acyl carrier protein